MSEYPVSLAGKPVARASVSVPYTGAWLATVELTEETTLSGSVELKIGDTTFRGVVDADRTGAFAGKMTAVVVGGAGAWGKSVAARTYHNDGGLQRSQIAIDAAREVGETLTVDSSVDSKVEGVDFLRQVGPASRVLDILFPAVPWYVGLDGITRLGPRTVTDATRRARLLELDRSRQCAELALEDADCSAVLPGSSISDADRLPGSSFVVHDVWIMASSAKLRAYASRATGRNADGVEAFRMLARAGDWKRTYGGIYRYRVYQMSGDRVELQVVNATLGLPDAIPVDMIAGVAGAWSELTPGAEVLVQFIEGDPSLPVVGGFTRKGAPGFLPSLVTIDATDKVAIGFEAPNGVELASAEDWATRADRNDQRLMNLAFAIMNAPITSPGDGGAGYQAAMKLYLTGNGWNGTTGEPQTTAADKVRLT